MAMSSRAGPTHDATAFMERVLALEPFLQQAGERIEQARRLPEDVVLALKQAGAFRMAMPRAWGGPEIDPVTQTRAVEELSRMNAAAGWCVMIGSDSGYFGAFFDDAAARAMYPDLDMVTASSLAPSGRAEPVDGGYRISGRWRFGSGCQHSDWFGVGCVVFDGNEPRKATPDQPGAILAMVPKADVAIVDTWTTTGLRGSGSHDFTVENVFVPAERASSLGGLRSTRSEPLYGHAAMFLINFAGPPLGVARAAVEELKALTKVKKAAFTGLPASQAPHVLSALARAEALTESARLYVYDTIADFWETLQRCEQPTLEQRGKLAVARTYAFHASMEAVDLAYNAAGGYAVYAGSRLERCFRDIHTMNQHVGASQGNYEQVAPMLLGMNSTSRLV